MKIATMLIILLGIAGIAHASKYQTNWPCAEGQFTCIVDDFVGWCCDKDPEKEGGCIWYYWGMKGCCGKPVGNLPLPPMCGDVNYLR